MAIRVLNRKYPNAQLLLSTIGINDDKVFGKMVEVSKSIEKVGLQFSIHESTDNARDKLIPYKKKYTLREIRDRGTLWNKEVGRPVYLNYCVDEHNATQQDIDNIKNLFSPVTFNMTFSVICESDETMNDKACQNLDIIRDFEKSFKVDGYNTRIFNPDGQDDIGGGCGQLFFVQQFLNKKVKSK